jgi:isopentenyldiphosphate isomerase
MSNPTPTFEYPPDLQEYAVPAEEFLRQHPEHHILCTGVAVFNKEGKLLLVQRAADEQAFPNCWVDKSLHIRGDLNTF